MAKQTEGYRKIYVKFTENTVDELDRVSEELGMTRTGLINYAVGMFLKTEKQKDSLLTVDSIQVLLTSLASAKKD